MAGLWGRAMGAEFKAKGANCQLGPGLNVARVPQGGRNFEYMSGEDPLLGSMLVGPAVQGIQSNGVIATAKHYILNNQEWCRGNMSADVDERTIMEIYHPPFEAAVKAGVGSIMCGYNRINGVYTCENEQTLDKHLRKFDGFDGFVMSDWGGTHSTGLAARTGLDMEMPGGTWFTPAKLDAALASGALTSDVIDTQATRILTAMYRVGIMDTPQPTGNSAVNATSEAHAALAQHLAEQAAVLLKNDQSLLPLRGKKGATIAVIGAAADCNATTPSVPNWGWAPSVGCLSSGGGSGSVAASYVTPILAAIQQQAAAAGMRVVYSSGQDARSAGRLAAAAEVAVVVVGTTSGESADRNGTSLPADQLEYLRAVARAQTKTVVVAMSPGSMTMDWADEVASVLCFFMPGQGQGGAVARVLFGDVNPSGKTPVTMPRTDNEMGFTASMYPGLDEHGNPVPSDCNWSPTNQWPVPHAVYSEKLLVGYRWYTAHPEVQPAFHFGSGLSYTTFAYSGARVTSSTPHGNHTIVITLTNTGNVEGAEVAQVYLKFPVRSHNKFQQSDFTWWISSQRCGRLKQRNLHCSSRALARSS